MQQNKTKLNVLLSKRKAPDLHRLHKSTYIYYEFVQEVLFKDRNNLVQQNNINALPTL